MLMYIAAPSSTPRARRIDGTPRPGRRQGTPQSRSALRRTTRRRCPPAPISVRVAACCCTPRFSACGGRGAALECAEVSTDQVETMPEPAEHSPAGPLPEASFPTRLWGYDRRAVDAYVELARSTVAEALAAGSVDGAVKAALDRVGEETSAVLQ